MNKYLIIATVVLSLTIVYLMTNPAPVDVDMQLDIQRKQDRITVDSMRIEELECQAESLDTLISNLKSEIERIKNSKNKKRKDYVKKVDAIRHLDADSTVIILSKNLSEQVGY